MAKYQFEQISVEIDNNNYKLLYSDIEKSFESVDNKFLRRLPPNARSRVMNLLKQTEGRLATRELEMLCDQYGIPFHYLIRELDLFDNSANRKTQLRLTLEGIQESLSSQILYLPTFRRIEQELNLIFKGLDDRELTNRRNLLAARRRVDTYVELVEFGMKDVESAVDETRTELEKFARENLNNLTFSYLGDIVEEQYKSVELAHIKKAEASTIDSILSRIPDQILSSNNKQHLKEIIASVKKPKSEGDHLHAMVICHYFKKLMDFHQQLGEKEAKIVNFCKACNEYMVNKEFIYDNSNFTFKIMSCDSRDEQHDIKLQQLSSGEKQIVSLFSHLYLSGGKNYFVLIDEPELSLSVVWQRRFLADIRKANFCSGLVAVTHSPFIYENELKKYAHGLGEFIV